MRAPARSAEDQAAAALAASAGSMRAPSRATCPRPPSAGFQLVGELPSTLAPAATGTTLKTCALHPVGASGAARGGPEFRACSRHAPSRPAAVPPGLPRGSPGGAPVSEVGVAWSSSGGWVVDVASPAFPPPPPPPPPDPAAAPATSTTVPCERVRYQPPAAAPAMASSATAVAAGRLRAQRPWRVGGMRCSMDWAARRHQGRFAWCRAASASERGMGPCAAGDQYRGGSPWSEASRSRADGCGLRGWALPFGAGSGVVRSMSATVDLRKVRIPVAGWGLWITRRAGGRWSPFRPSGTRDHSTDSGGDSGSEKAAVSRGERRPPVEQRPS